LRLRWDIYNYIFYSHLCFLSAHSIIQPLFGRDFEAKEIHTCS
jgi:hypothetical protein